MAIVERNHHHFCPSYVAPGRDAAVAFSSIDLRFSNPYPFPIRLHAFIDVDKVRIDMYAPQDIPIHPQVVTRVLRSDSPETFTIGRRAGRARLRNSGRPGYEVTVYRVTGDAREFISSDEYPVMNRLVEYR
jgi:vancomycin resistance protein YoaR